MRQTASSVSPGTSPTGSVYRPRPTLTSSYGPCPGAGLHCRPGGFAPLISTITPREPTSNVKPKGDVATAALDRGDLPKLGRPPIQKKFAELSFRRRALNPIFSSKDAAAHTDLLNARDKRISTVDENCG